MAHAFVNRGLAASDRHSYVGRPHARDSRIDLGYGTLEPKFHVNKKQSSNFPYLDDDIDLPEEEVLDDVDVDKFLAKADLVVTKNDMGSRKGTDPFYYVAGNTKLSDCFSRPEDVLKEIDAMESMMSVKEIRIGGSRPTGSKKGYTGQVPDIVSDTLDVEDDVIFSLEDILNVDDISVKKARDVRASVGKINKRSREV